jgi:hypothetical protein
MLVILIICLKCTIVNAQNRTEEREDIQRLVVERADRFNEYLESIKKRSGIFGNKTRRDLEQSNEVLISIVTTDNKIIDALNRIRDYKTFEKTNINYAAEQCAQKLKQSMLVTDTLTKQLNAAELNIKRLNTKTIKLKGLFYLSFATLVISLIYIYRFRRKLTGS